MQRKNLPKQFLLLPILLLIGFISKAQLLTESFEGATFPPAGWLNNQLVGGTTNVWLSAAATTQTNPNSVTPHTGAAMALYDPYNYAAGESAELVTPALDFTTGGPFRVKFWMYRDTRYTANDDSLEVFVNTSATSVGGTKLGGIWRQIADAPVVAAAGWYQYSFDIPAGFNSASNFIAFVGNSDYGTEMVIDDVVVEAQPTGCSGTPSAGVISGPSAACTGVNFTLTNTGATEAVGVNYSWQSSASAAGPWANIPGQTNFAQAIIVQTSSTYYRFVDTCTISSQTAISNVIQVTMNPTSQCYCKPPAVTLHSFINDLVTNVSIPSTTLNSSNATNLTTGYTSVAPTPANNTGSIQQSSSAAITATIDDINTTQVSVWVDFNQNGSFEASEFFDLTISGTSATGNIVVPGTALLGQTGMRVRARAANFTSGDACGSFASGETEDYTITISTPPSCIQPQALTARAVSSTSDSISWNRVVTADNYEWAVTTSATPPAVGTATGTNNDTAVLAGTLASGTQYYAHVRSDCGGGSFSSWSTISFTTLRANDLCAEALDVTSQIATNAADTVGKGTLVTSGFEGLTVNAPCSNTSTGGNNDVWFKFTAPANGDSVIIAGAAGSDNDWVFQLFGSCGGAQLACSDDGNAANPFGNQYMPTIGICGLTPGATYYVRAYPYLAAAPAVSETSVLYVYSGGSCPVPPANDECANATDITSSCGAPVSGTTVNAGASGSIANTSCGSSFANQTDVWYKFNTGNSMVLPYVRVTGIDTLNGKNVYAAVYHGNSCSNLIYDGCVSPSGDSIIAYIAGVDANQDYYVRVYSINTPQQTTFNISICDSTSSLSVDTTGQGICAPWGSITINATNQNNNRWIRIINSGLMAEINANGNDLGSTSFNIYRNNSGTIRRDATNAPQLGTEYMDRNITITPTNQPATPVSIRMYFTNAELNALIAAGGDNYNDVLSINNLVVTKNQQACGSSFLPGNNATLIAPSGNGNFADGAFVEFSVPSFSTFFLNGGFGALPVTFTSFNAQRNGKINKLTWSTSQEINARYFVVERSKDGRNYSPIGQVAASGTSSIEQSYAFIDEAPAKGINYYRLRIVDNGNAAKYSVIRNVRNEGTADIAVYPNPVKDEMKLNITSDKADKATVTISDMSGKLVYSSSLNVFEGVNNLKIATGGFTNGTYIIKIKLTEDIVVRKFNKL